MLLYALLAAPLLAQSANWHSLKISQAQSTELFAARPAAGEAASPAPAVAVQFETWVEQLPAQDAESVLPLFAGIEKDVKKSTIRRLIRDNFRNVEVRYSLTVEPGPGGRDYRLTFDDVPEPQGPTSSKLEGWKFLSPAVHLVPQIVQKGEVIKVELYTNPRRVKLVEYIRIAEPGRQPLRSDSPRDAFADDAEFSIANPRFSVNGKPQRSGPTAPELHAPALRVHVPGFGTYVLALKQHPGQNFETAGEVVGKTLTFVAQGNLIRIESADRIASGSAVYNVYARLDAAGENAESAEASSNRISLEAAEVVEAQTLR